MKSIEIELLNQRSNKFTETEIVSESWLVDILHYRQLLHAEA